MKSHDSLWIGNFRVAGLSACRWCKHSVRNWQPRHLPPNHFETHVKNTIGSRSFKRRRRIKREFYHRLMSSVNVAFQSCRRHAMRSTKQVNKRRSQGWKSLNEAHDQFQSLRCLCWQRTRHRQRPSLDLKARRALQAPPGRRDRRDRRELRARQAQSGLPVRRVQRGRLDLRVQQVLWAQPARPARKERQDLRARRAPQVLRDCRARRVLQVPRDCRARRVLQVPRDCRARRVLQVPRDCRARRVLQGLRVCRAQSARPVPRARWACLARRDRWDLRVPLVRWVHRE